MELTKEQALALIDALEVSLEGKDDFLMRYNQPLYAAYQVLREIAEEGTP